MTSTSGAWKQPSLAPSLLHLGMHVAELGRGQTFPSVSKSKFDNERMAKSVQVREHKKQRDKRGREYGSPLTR